MLARELTIRIASPEGFAEVMVVAFVAAEINRPYV